jgi:hypothetical protein
MALLALDMHGAVPAGANQLSQSASIVLSFLLRWACSAAPAWGLEQHRWQAEHLQRDAATVISHPPRGPPGAGGQHKAKCREDRGGIGLYRRPSTTAPSWRLSTQTADRNGNVQGGIIFHGGSSALTRLSCRTMRRRAARAQTKPDYADTTTVEGRSQYGEPAILTI